MKTAMTIAAYINNRYAREFGERIEEMKLHKLMYFTQRECLIQTGEPMFTGRIEGWRLGPVVPVIRESYANNSFDANITDETVAEYKAVLDYVFEHYAVKEAWSLSRLSQGEICWKNSRKGVAPHESSYRPIKLDDIRLDAIRIRDRRQMLEAQGLL